MKTCIKEILFEAFRRNKIADSCDLSKPMNKRWLGLGYKTTYKVAVEDGYMAWIFGAPKDRCMGWLHLTDKGVEALNLLIPEFEEKWEKMEKSSYSEDRRIGYKG